MAAYLVPVDYFDYYCEFSDLEASVYENYSTDLDAVGPRQSDWEN